MLNRKDPVRLALLTTDTAHHRYFVQRLCRELPPAMRLTHVICETKPYPWGKNAIKHVSGSLPNLWRALAENPYWQPRRLGKMQAAYEEPRFFPSGDRNFPSDVDVHTVYSVNAPEGVSLLEAAHPDLLLVYGTGRVHRHIFSLPALGTINAHGGKLPHYRGLDTNLWAALEGLPEAMCVTLHQMDDQFDTGPVYCSRSIPRQPDLSLHSLRYFTALVCTDLFLELIQKVVSGKAQAVAQPGGGRYYGPMPWLLKRQVDRILRAYGAA